MFAEWVMIRVLDPQRLEQGIFNAYRSSSAKPNGMVQCAWGLCGNQAHAEKPREVIKADAVCLSVISTVP